jgi:hypothetical protein
MPQPGENQVNFGKCSTLLSWAKYTRCTTATSFKLISVMIQSMVEWLTQDYINLYTYSAAILLIAGAVAVGYLIGGPGTGTRKVLALGTGQRNMAAAFAVATSNFQSNPLF